MTYYLAAGVVVAIWVATIVKDAPWSYRVLQTLISVTLWPAVLVAAGGLWVLGKMLERD